MKILFFNVTGFLVRNIPYVWADLVLCWERIPKGKDLVK